MTSTLSLRGQCACGRNDYAISIPENATRTVNVVFDDTAEHRRAHSTPLPVFLRIPLPWIASNTYAFFPDERHADIRKVFTPSHEPHIKRHFCGFCGSPLTYWHERSREDAEWICISLGSLEAESLDTLSEAGILGREEEEEEEEDENVESGKGGERAERHVSPLGTGVLASRDQDREVRGQPWFEEMLEGSALGRLRRRRGGRTSKDGRSQVEWEIVEFEGSDADGAQEVGMGTVKRKKLGEMADEDDLPVRASR